MEKRLNWTRPQVLAALHLYTQLPLGQLHQRNPCIRQLAEWLDRTPGSVAMKLTNLASLDPQITSSGRRGLSGASAVDRTLWKELEADWDTVALQAAAEYDRLALNHGISGEVDTDIEPPFDEPGRTRDAVVSVRVNQTRFRRSVLSSYRSRCCVSDLGDERLLVASHIVPWAQDSRNRLNPRNGLCLSTLHDTAFDRGLFTVTPEGGLCADNLPYPYNARPNIACSSTLHPASRSSGVAFSISLCEMPPSHGTKIIAVGATRAR